MANKTQLQLDSEKYLRFLKKSNLLTDEHSLTVSLVKELCITWAECTSATQKAAVSKELRAAIEMLPHAEVKLQGEVETFLEDLEKV